MAEILQILTYPNPLLRRRAAEVEEVDTALRDTVSTMFETMYAHKGVGLAAPQVGIGRKIIVFNPSGERADEQVLINPAVIDRRGAMEAEEGCLSFPGICGIVRRNSNIVVAAYDLDGGEVEIPAADFMARVLQHEIDHVEGRLFVDRMTPESRIAVREALKDLEDSYGRAVVESGERS